MTFDMVRIAAAGFLVWVALSGTPDVVPPVIPQVVEKYTGPMTQLHAESRSMMAADRGSLSEGLEAGANMVAADQRGLISTTSKAQDFLIGLLEFNYNGVGKPSQRYAGVASAVEAEFRKAVGDDVATLDASGRSKIEATLREMSKAVR